MEKQSRVAETILRADSRWKGQCSILHTTYRSGRHLSTVRDAERRRSRSVHRHSSESRDKPHSLAAGRPLDGDGPHRSGGCEREVHRRQCAIEWYDSAAGRAPRSNSWNRRETPGYTLPSCTLSLSELRGWVTLAGIHSAHCVLGTFLRILEPLRYCWERARRRRTE